jgi:chemotaxis protein MotA
MNFSTLLGFGVALAVLIFAVSEADQARSVLLDRHALMIVLGGTCAAAFVSFPIKRIFKLSVLAFRRIIGFAEQDYEGVIRQVIRIAEGLQSDPNFARNTVAQVKHPFLKEGLQLIVDGATEDQLVDILEARIETFRRRYSSEVTMFRTIGKFPPAFGLLGTTFGMISLLNKLGQPEAHKMMGPAMAIGLVATLYGIGLTNFIFVPIAENLNALGSDDYAARKMVLEGLVMVKRKTHPILVEEKMKSFLLPSERVDFSRAGDAQAAPNKARPKAS